MSVEPLLFTPLQLRSVTLPNRVVLSPLCMYSARDGIANEFHLSHLSAFARGRVGLVFTEATAVEPRGRISHGCCGLWNDAQAEAYAPIARYISSLGSVPAIQIAHAGRKGSAHPPWAGGLALGGGDASAGTPPWQCIGPSAEPVGAGWPAPQALTEVRDRRRHRGVCKRRASCRQSWFPRARDPRCARLSAAQLPLAAVQPTQRPLRR